MSFNLKSQTEVLLLHLMAKSEGILQREDFPTKNLFYKMKNEGYIKKCADSFKTTDKFKHDYTKEVDKTARFGCTGSSIHGREIMNILKTLPTSALSSVQSAADLAAEHKTLSKTAGYKTAVSNIHQDLVNQRTEIQSRLKECKSPLAAV